MSTLNPAQTIIVPPADITWKVPDAASPNSVAEATLGGGQEWVDPSQPVLRQW